MKTAKYTYAASADVHISFFVYRNILNSNVLKRTQTRVGNRATIDIPLTAPSE